MNAIDLNIVIATKIVYVYKWMIVMLNVSS